MLKANAVFSGFSVDDLDKAKEFYVEKLGLTLDNEKMGLTLKFPNGGSVFIYKRDGHEPAKYTMMNFVVDDIDQAVEELKSQGITLESYDNIPGGLDEKGIARGIAAGKGPDIAWFKDPAGNVISVLQEA